MFWLPLSISLLLVPTQAPPKVELEIAPDTTVVDGPVNPDGTINYVAALNAELSKGVTLQNNAFVDIALMLGPGMWPDAVYRQRLHEMLGVDVPADDDEFFVPFGDYFAELIPDEDRRDELLDRLLSSPWTPAEFPQAAKWLAANRKPLATLEQAVTKPQHYVPLIDLGKRPLVIRILLPHLRAARSMARTLQARAMRRLGHGDVEAAWRDVMTAKRLSRLVGRDQIVISGLVGISITRIIGSAVEAIAASEHLTPAQARRMIADLQSLPPLPTMAEAIDRGERFSGLDALMYLRQARATTLRDVDVETDKDAWHQLGRLITHTEFDPNRALRKINGLYDELVDIYTMDSFDDYVARSDAFDEELRQRAENTAILDGLATLAKIMSQPRAARRRQFTDHITDRFAALMLLGFGAARRAEIHAEMFEQLEPVALAIGAYRAEHGEYPQTLNLLVPDYLADIPVDIFSQEPIRYRRDPDASVIYSVGTNQRDDGGIDEKEDGRPEDLVIRLEQR